MFKQMKKKLNNKKGFTLAELLVVIAILAILIAIAIPVFSNMVADSNLRVNQANVHSVRSAAVTKILTSLDEADDSSAKTLFNQGLAENSGWVAIADVDNAGNIDNLRVYVKTESAGEITTNWADGISQGTVSDEGTSGLTDSGNFYVMPEKVDTTSKFASVKPTTGDNETYTVQAVITDLDLESTT